MNSNMRRYVYAAASGIVLALLAAGVFLAATSATTMDTEAIPEPDTGLRLTATPIPSDGVISVDEPLLVKIEWQNTTGELMEWLDSLSAAEIMGTACPTTCVAVKDSEGKVLSALPRPTKLVLDGWRSVTKLKPGETKSRVIIVTGMHKFKKPGDYIVQIEQLGTTEGLPVLAEATIPITVLPFDASRLEARCEELLQPVRNGTSSTTDLELGIRTKALYSVHNDVALPYLEWLAREMGANYACEAMILMNTERSLSLMRELTARNDELGETARKGEKASRCMIWDTAIY